MKQKLWIKLRCSFIREFQLQREAGYPPAALADW